MKKKEIDRQVHVLGSLWMSLGTLEIFVDMDGSEGATTWASDPPTRGRSGVWMDAHGTWRLPGAMDDRVARSSERNGGSNHVSNRCDMPTTEKALSIKARPAASMVDSKHKVRVV